MSANAEDRDPFGGQSPPDETHPYLGLKENCDSVIDGFAKLGITVECWHPTP
jgi:hypothetical protein